MLTYSSFWASVSTSCLSDSCFLSCCFPVAGSLVLGVSCSSVWPASCLVLELWFPALPLLMSSVSHGTNCVSKGSMFRTRSISQTRILLWTSALGSPFQSLSAPMTLESLYHSGESMKAQGAEPFIYSGWWLLLAVFRANLGSRRHSFPMCM